MFSEIKIIEVAIPGRLYSTFDYLPIKDNQIQQYPTFARVKIPFRNKKIIGFVVKTKSNTDIPINKLKPIIELYDIEPLINQDVINCCLFLEKYYLQPLGEIIQLALPKKLREGKSSPLQTIQFINITSSGLKKIDEKSWQKKANKQAAILDFINKNNGCLLEELQNQFLKNKALINTLITNNLLSVENKAIKKFYFCDKKTNTLTLNPKQQIALNAIKNKLNLFQVFMLYGITGSGKTEVYIHSAIEALKQNQQILILVPEINLTPQLIERFTKSIPVKMRVLHSNLTDRARLEVWHEAKNGALGIVIGTRSAIFTPFANLGLIIIDEEHDASFKQQEGLRYSARDLSIFRAKENKIPIILGSATPSLETLHNANKNRYIALELTERTKGANLPNINLIDMRQTSKHTWLENSSIKAIKNCLSKNEQVLIFLNRRGFAPIFICSDCQTLMECPRCHKAYTFHQIDNKLRCHHCEAAKHPPSNCQNCKSKNLIPLGLGTERLEENLKDLFPEYEIIRVDKDTIKTQTALNEHLVEINKNKALILIGTQMLAKGHHFPKVSLVVVVNPDNALFSSDCFAPEKMVQQIIQVAGRAGRENIKGEVLIQTRYPEHSLLKMIVNEEYKQIASNLLEERKEANLPPYNFLAIVRAHSIKQQEIFNFLYEVKKLLTITDKENILTCLGPMPSPMPKRQGKYRAQLILQSNNRTNLNLILRLNLKKIKMIPNENKVRWSIDIDPKETL